MDHVESFGANAAQSLERGGRLSKALDKVKTCWFCFKKLSRLSCHSVQLRPGLAYICIPKMEGDPE